MERRVDVPGDVLADILKALRALERPTPQKRWEIGFARRPDLVEVTLIEPLPILRFVQQHQ